MRAWMGGVWAAFLACAPISCAPATTTSTAEPALWRIADSDSEIWLYGTVHVLPPALRWRGPRFEAAFAAAEEFVTETDTAEAATNYAALTRQYGVQPPGARLADALDAATQARLARAADRLNLDPAALDTMRPWLAAVQLSYTYAAADGHAAAAGVENVLVPEARAAGKRLSYLETPELQIRTLADLSPADQLRFLTATLEQIEADAQALDRIDALWVRGDVEALGRDLDAQLKDAGPAVFDALIVRRNHAWADEIERRLAGSGRTFYAVGAAHLAGEASVVALLRERGVTVEGP